jgi:hypothetical protein
VEIAAISALKTRPASTKLGYARCVRAWALWLAALALSGCDGDGIEVIVELRTDYVGRFEVAMAHTRLFAGDESAPLRDAEEVLPEGDLTSGVRIAELGGLSTGSYRLEVDLVRGDGAVAATRVVRFDAAENRGVTVIVTRSCEAILCPPPGGDAALVSCVGGRCVDPGCTPETPERCPSPECTTGADCPGGAVSCAVGECLGGACAVRVRDDLCGDGERCDPSAGCVARPPEDGGTTDGGGTDANVCGLGEAAPRCNGTMLERCVAGALVSEPCALGCGASPEAHCLELVPSNIDVDGLATTDPVPVRITSSTRWDTEACESITGGRTVMAGGSTYCLVYASAFEIVSGTELAISGGSPLIVFAAESIIVSGTLQASARGAAAGPGGGTEAGIGPAWPGRGGGGPASIVGSAGGGGGGFCGRGGLGGDGDGVVGGTGGSSDPTYELVPLRGGAPGGPATARPGAGGGGGGGGAIQLTAYGFIEVSGQILLGGGGGGGGMARNPPAGGGGGGSGGALLLETPDLRLRTGARIVVSGGGGGASAQCVGGTDGPAGGDGDGVGAGGNVTGLGDSCAAELTGANGGDGSRSGLDGMGGMRSSATGGTGGGGGGGAGCVLVRAGPVGTTPPGVIVPNVAPAFRTLPLRTM